MPWLLRMTLVVSVIMVPAVVYLSYRLHFLTKYYFPAKSGMQILIPVILCSFYLFPVSGLLDFYATGGIDVLKYPKVLTYWFWFGLVFVFQLATWLILADLSKLIARFFPVDEKRLARIHAWLAVILFGALFCFMGWKVYNDTTNITIENSELKIEDLPDALQGMKIVHISDIQGDEYTGRARIDRYIQKVNAQNPDLIIFTGDLISYGTDFINMAAEEFGRAEAKYGTFAVVGDHDYWAGVEDVRRALEREGIPLLQDENRTVAIDSTTHIQLTGITEVYSKASDPAVVDSLTSSPTNAELKIFASHQVADQLISSARQNNYDLMLAGHTHGGQIRVPFMGMSFSASERETEYVSGLYLEEGLPINVNNGLGFTLAPIRYNAPPAITVIKLKKE